MICLVMTGPPGVGKTTVGRLVSELLSARFLNISECYTNDSGFSLSDRNRAFSNLLTDIQSILELRINVVVEVFLYRTERRQSLQQLLEHAGYRMVVACLTSDIDCLLDRVRRRSSVESTSDIPEDRVREFVKSFEKLECEMRINTSKREPEDIAASIVKELQTWT